MAKNKTKKEEKKGDVYPSTYGSHRSMVDTKMTEELKQKGKVVCRDASGTYVTDESRLDNRMADTNRYCGRVLKIEQEKTAVSK
jgi:hypothetical protein